MSTYGEMQASIALYMRRTDLTTEIMTAIKRAINHYEKEAWPWIELRNTSLVTAADVRSVALPTDFVFDVLVKVTFGTTIYDLRKRTIAEIETMYTSDDFTGQPTDYAIWSGSLFLYPIPNAAYTLTTTTYDTIPALVNDTDTNAWTTDAEDLIEAHAIWWLCSAVTANPARATAALDREARAYRQLRARATLQESSGTLKSNC